ncbi:MAG: hypothetical protein GVY32_11785, partial [Gammaproteobacteria bacterium]|nr:hypothetical protein [Gammaproteobacteria bacterium]
MTSTTRIHSVGDAGFAEFLAGIGHRRPTASRTPVDVAIIGHTGQVGRALLSQLATSRPDPRGPALVFREGINRSRHLVVDRREVREVGRDRGSLAGLGERLAAGGRPAVIVDCTADADLPRSYPAWLRAGIGVVTPNKHGFAGDLSLYRAIHESARLGNAPLGYSATVGAGLPILSTLRRLHQAGSEPTHISAVVSGTLAHVFSRMAGGLALSAAVGDARERGFTEPDPLEDLSGRDVARKLLIMLREAGLEGLAVEREPVVADAWAARAREAANVMEALRECDGTWRRRFESAQAAGETWVYLARVGPGEARVGPVRLPADSPFAVTGGSGNI